MSEVELKTGSFTVDELEALFLSLPVDITFVDKNDEVKYFNAKKDRVFSRAVGILGKNVRDCHPEKSLHLVNKIVDEFKSGERDVAEFWIQKMTGQFIHIRYFPVRDEEGEYLGVVEVTQDIQNIKKLEDEKRLLDD